MTKKETEAQAIEASLVYIFDPTGYENGDPQRLYPSPTSAKPETGLYQGISDQRIIKAPQNPANALDISGS